jgi:glycerol-1-phosphate dehydrogenase [NAD(P)+]
MTSEERIEKALEISTDTRFFEMKRNCLGEAPAVFNKFFKGRKPVIVASHNTWDAAGKSVYEAFQDAGIPAEKYIVDKKVFHAEWRYVDMVDAILDGDLAKAKSIENDPDYKESDAEKSARPASEDYPVAVAVGSGVINDLCKLASFHHAQSYLTIPTAASVDGYTSFGASITYHNAKQTFNCPAPIAVLADIDVIAAAPMSMTAAGYADLAAKIPAGAEWMIADVVGVEPIIPNAWHVLQDCLDELLSDPEGVAKRDPKAIGNLFEGLILSGFAMQAAKSSRPASCCDHLFSHILDMTGHRYHGELQSHGFQVAIGTLTMCAIFDSLFNYDLSKLDVEACVAKWPTLEQEQQRAIEIFKNFPAKMLGYENITKKYSDAAGVRRELTDFKQRWPELSVQLRRQVYPFKKMQSMFKAVGAPYDPSMIGVTRHQLHDMFPIVQLMRWRFNVLDLAKRACFYDSLVESIFKPGAPWDLGDEQPIK